MAAVLLIGLIDFCSMFGNRWLVDTHCMCCDMSDTQWYSHLENSAEKEIKGLPGVAQVLLHVPHLTRRMAQTGRSVNGALQSGNVSLFSALCEDYGPDYPRFMLDSENQLLEDFKGGRELRSQCNWNESGLKWFDVVWVLVFAYQFFIWGLGLCRAVGFQTLHSSCHGLLIVIVIDSHRSEMIRDIYLGYLDDDSYLLAWLWIALVTTHLSTYLTSASANANTSIGNTVCVVSEWKNVEDVWRRAILAVHGGQRSPLSHWCWVLIAEHSTVKFRRGWCGDARLFHPLIPLRFHCFRRLPWSAADCFVGCHGRKKVRLSRLGPKLVSFESCYLVQSQPIHWGCIQCIRLLPNFALLTLWIASDRSWPFRLDFTICRICSSPWWAPSLSCAVCTGRSPGDHLAPIGHGDSLHEWLLSVFPSGHVCSGLAAPNGHTGAIYPLRAASGVCGTPRCQGHPGSNQELWRHDCGRTPATWHYLTKFGQFGFGFGGTRTLLWASDESCKHYVTIQWEAPFLQWVLMKRKRQQVFFASIHFHDY